MILAAAAGLAAAAVEDPLYPDLVSLPAVGDTGLRALTPRLLEVRAVEAAGTDPARPAPGEFAVTLDGEELKPARTGLRRMPVYADYHEADARIVRQVFLELPKDLRSGERVEVKAPGGESDTLVFSEDRISPAIHFNRHGFAPDAPKFAFVSLDLGTLGEMDLPGTPAAALVDVDGREVFAGPLVERPDREWAWHQKVWRFDFSSWRTPGEYRIAVPGLGVSAPVRIDPSAPAVSARLLALGFYNQRSGEEKGVPFTRFGHPASHTRPAEIPDGSVRFRATEKHLAAMAKKNTEGQQAPLLDSYAASLYPIVREGSADVAGGHFDAGDYSKYSINSAQVVHNLTFAVDHFPGVAAIDNLGLPESGDGTPDALQIAAREARFLLKMQDADGGFFFLVYPRDRPYEHDVLPQDGDPQVVFPKNTAATAACTGALAQLSASPALQAWDPELAAACLGAARRGYEFLRNAVARHGFGGSYQAISHYGNFDGHRDELCFAAAAMFAATGDKAFEDDLRLWWPDPLDGRDRKWGWLPLYESYGSAARVYAFAEEPGFLAPGTSDPAYRKSMRELLRRSAEVWLRLSDANAFGLPFSLSSKRQKRAGWFWAMDSSVDAITAFLLDPEDGFRARILDALAMWSGYEAGANPMNRSFITGDGPVWRRQAVNRISLNDDRRLTVPGIPVGNVVSTPHNLKPYQVNGANGLRQMFTPSLDSFTFYDRSGTDAYNVREEWTVATGARLLAGHLFLMARSTAAAGRWVPVRPSIVGVPAEVRTGETLDASLELPPPLESEGATVVWELAGREPVVGAVFRGAVGEPGPGRLEAEIIWPDGRRLAAVSDFLIVK